MIPVKIFIESTIWQEMDQKPEVIRQELPGRFQEKGDGEWILWYKENGGTSEEIVTAVKSRPDQILIVRKGSVSYRQFYKPGKTMKSIVYTPAGATEMEVETLTYKRKRLDQEGQLRFSFLLHMGKQRLGKYELGLRWIGG
ncbi:DUF1934 domain-containing protein [Thermoactinomyces mirandus]|uniref:DUF1934 domain-containing protein n=1 Tax=Thermoactinomyces mirandus TaxID=2756294 RepID=A0A7W1XTF0_9BACL|nr:DUF1934 domain-containing protein [Thermoactinomyces mirandus]MBA4602904.1 DUF1934 domain-containing protein [Thermoactinomyces mirandus]